MIHKLGAENAQLTGAISWISDSGGVGGGLRNLIQWLARSLNQHFNEWSPMDDLPEVKWPRSDKFWLGGLCSLYHLLLMEMKRTGRKWRWSELFAVCRASHPFIHLSPSAPPFTPCFNSTGLLMAPDHVCLFLSFCTCSFCLEFMYSAFFSSLNFRLHSNITSLWSLPDTPGWIPSSSSGPNRTFVPASVLVLENHCMFYCL